MVGRSGICLARIYRFRPGATRRIGWVVLAKMRRLGQQTPVLFLTARDAIEDRVKGLELGADDYLVKPFAFSELLARARSILRRGAARQPEILRVADLEVTNDICTSNVLSVGGADAPTGEPGRTSAAPCSGHRNCFSVMSPCMPWPT